MLNKILRFFYFDLGCKLRYLFWKLIVTSLGGKVGKNVIFYEGVRINGKVIIRDNVRILRNVTISTDGAGVIFIGNNVHIGEGTIIFSRLRIEIRNEVIIGPQNIIVDHDHIYKNQSILINKQGHNLKKVLIEDDVWISSHCCILKGVTIGRGCVIGASAVVNKDIPNYSIAVGIPAKVIKQRNNE
ncbi:MAG: acyltransferase [Candidatus Omnitrophota bacterium]